MSFTLLLSMRKWFAHDEWCVRSDMRKPVGAVTLLFKEEEGKGFPYLTEVSDANATRFKRRGSIFNRRGSTADSAVVAATHQARRMSIDARQGAGGGLAEAPGGAAELAEIKGEGKPVTSGAALMEVAASMDVEGYVVKLKSADKGDSTPGEQLKLKVGRLCVSLHAAGSSRAPPHSVYEYDQIAATPCSWVCDKGFMLALENAENLRFKVKAEQAKEICEMVQQAKTKFDLLQEGPPDVEVQLLSLLGPKWRQYALAVIQSLKASGVPPSEWVPTVQTFDSEEDLDAFMVSITQHYAEDGKKLKMPKASASSVGGDTGDVHVASPPGAATGRSSSSESESESGDESSDDDEGVANPSKTVEHITDWQPFTCRFSIPGPMGIQWEEW